MVNEIMEKAKEYQFPLYMAFVDYEKAFDSSKHEAVIKSLHSIGVDQAYINVLLNIYDTGRTEQLRTDTIGEEFGIEKGVRQGDNLSPNLFKAALEEIFKRTELNETGIQINDELLNNLRFADAIVLFANTRQGRTRANHKELEH